MRAVLLLLVLGAVACKPEPGFDDRYRSEEERLGQSARSMEREAAQSIAGAEAAARAMGEQPAPLPVGQEAPEP